MIPFKYFLILLFLVLSFHVLPGQLAQEEINQHVDHAFHIISSSLLDPQVCVYGSVPRSSSQIFVVFVGNVSAIKRVFLSQSKVNYENSVALFVLPH